MDALRPRPCRRRDAPQSKRQERPGRIELSIILLPPFIAGLAFAVSPVAIRMLSDAPNSVFRPWLLGVTF